MSDEAQRIKRCCKAIETWYKTFGKESPRWLDYFIDAGYCDDNGIPYDDELDEEFKDSEQCSIEMLNFDPIFPLPAIHEKKQRNKLVFYVLQYCYQNLCAPSIQIIMNVMNASKDTYSKQNRKHLTKRTPIDTIDESTEYEATPINHTLNVNARSFTMNNTNTMDASLVNTVIDDRKEAIESNPKSPSKSKGYKKTKKHKKWTDAALYSYFPDSAYRGQGNVDIPRRFTEETAPNAIKEDIKHLFPYLDKTIAMQNIDGQAKEFNIDNNGGTGKIKIFNCDLHDNGDNLLYFVVEQQPKTKANRNYGWKTIGLFHQNTIKNIYGISSNKLPKSSRKMALFLKQLHCRCITVDEIKKLIKTTNWTKKNVLHKINNNMRMTFNITKPEFIKKTINIFRNKDDNENIELIPILLFRDNKQYYIEHICILSINDMVDIGVSLKYNEKNDQFIVKGIHLDKEMIAIHHELALPEHHECHCLDNFKCNIDYFSIGNCDNILNQRNDYKQKCEVYKEFISWIANEYPDPESIQKKAQKILPNGKNTKITMDTDKAESSLNEASTNGASIIYLPIFMQNTTNIHQFGSITPQFAVQYQFPIQNINIASNMNGLNNNIY